LKQGTPFKVYLPATSQEGELSPRNVDPVPMGHGETILIVDDEAAIRDITKSSLEAYGYKVLLADDGAEAVAIIAQNMGKIHAVLLDIVMPIMDGHAVVRALQKMDSTIRILAISGIFSDENVFKMTGTSIGAFLAKPYTAEQLLKKLHEVLVRS
jgi:DNA-binding response OmpR family regulator